MKLKRTLSLTLAFIFILAVFNLGAFAAAKVLKPKAVITVQPKTQYLVGDRISFAVKSLNYKGKVQYRVNIRNASGQIIRELWPSLPGKYYNKQISPLGSFSIATSIKEAGTYFFVVYVKRPNAKGYYDTYALTRKFVVKEKVSVEEPKDVVLDKDGQEYNAEAKVIEKDVYLSANNTKLLNAKVNGTIYVNPGENGNATLENVEAEKVVVLSGGFNSIHFKSLKAKEVEVDTKAKVRVASEGTTSVETTKVYSDALVETTEGSFGNVLVQPKVEGKVVELKGKFNLVKILSAVNLKSIGATVEKVEVSTDKADAKVVLDGQLKYVELLSAAKVEVASGKIEKLEVKAKVEITVNKDAQVTELNKNGNEVTLNNNGQVDKVDGVVQSQTGGTTGGSIGGGVVTPEYKALDDFMSDLMVDAIAVKNEHAQLYGNYVNSIDYANRTLTINLKSTAGSETPSSLYSKFVGRLKAGYHQDLTNNDKALLDDFLGTNGLMNNVRVTATGFNNVTLKTYAVGKLSGHIALVNFINNPSETNYDAVRNQLMSDSYDSYTEIALLLHALVPGDNVTIDSMSVYGLSVNELKIDNTTIYGGADKTISVNEIKSALGIQNVPAGQATISQVLGQDKTIELTLKLQGTSGIYTYKVVINLE